MRMLLIRKTLAIAMIQGVSLMLSQGTSAAPADAVLVTPALVANNPKLGGSPRGYCSAVNAGQFPRNIRIEIYGANHTLLVGTSTSNVQPGFIAAAVVPVLPATAGAGFNEYCMITINVRSGEKRQDVAASIRASVLVIGPDGNTIASAEAR